MNLCGGLLEDHVNNPLLLAIVAAVKLDIRDPRKLPFQYPNPKSIQRAKQNLERGMLQYLEARSASGTVFEVTNEQLPKLQAIATDLGFVLEKVIASDDINWFQIAKEKPPAKRPWLKAMCSRFFTGSPPTTGSAGSAK